MRLGLEKIFCKAVLQMLQCSNEKYLDKYPDGCWHCWCARTRGYCSLQLQFEKFKMSMLALDTSAHQSRRMVPRTGCVTRLESGLCHTVT